MNSKECVVLLGVKKINYLCINMSKNKNDGKNRNFNESQNAYKECIPDS